MKLSRARTAVGLALVIAGSACSASNPSPSADGSEVVPTVPVAIPSDSLTTPEPRRYRSMEAITDALADVGLSCEVFEPLGPGNNAATLKDFAICETIAGRLNIYLPKDIDAWRHIADQVPGVVGPNWIVLAPGSESTADTIHAALGGERPAVTAPSG